MGLAITVIHKNITYIENYLANYFWWQIAILQCSNYNYIDNFFENYFCRQVTRIISLRIIYVIIS